MTTNMRIKRELETRAQRFNRELTQYLKKQHPELLYEASRHLPLGGGKRLRPSLAMFSCESVNGDAQKIMPFGVALELVHNFTLVHDDIMDHARLRRNLPTVHIKFGEPTAILAGDFLFAKAFEAMHDIDTYPAVFKTLDYGLVKCIEHICEGQQLDMEYEKRPTVTEPEYLDMVQKKTAVLFQFAARGGAILGNGTKDEIQALTDYGKFLGLGFQIWDDYLDLSSDEKTLGKDIGNDIRNGKKTLVAVHALHHATRENKKIVGEIFGNPTASEHDIKRILRLFRETQSIDYARDTAVQYNKKAKQALTVLRESDAKELLKELADFSVQREK